LRAGGVPEPEKLLEKYRRPEPVAGKNEFFKL
jgi:hypothetical protein